MKIDPGKLQKELSRLGIINEKEFLNLQKLAKKSKHPITKLLVEKDFISEDNLARLMSEILDVPYIDISLPKIPKDCLELIPEKLARESKVIAFEKDKNKVKVAMVDPTNLETIGLVRKTTGKQVEPYITSERKLKRAIVLYKKGIEEEFQKIIDENVKKAKKTGVELERAALELPIIKIADTIIDYAVAEEASDIHIEPQEEEVLIRFRIDGILHDVLYLPKYIHPSLVARIKVLTSLKIDEHRKPQDGRFKRSSDSQDISIRTSIMPTFYGEKIVMRLLFEEAKGFSLSELGLWGYSLKAVTKAIKKPFGMILATGPTGSGKTTTLYTVLNTLNSGEVNICTIEDPIEYSIRGVNQTQVNNKVGLNFATGLRSLVRQDPDIIMVGEIRDVETADIAVHSALTGHLVLSTLHTNDAAGTIPRIVDMKVEPFLAASTINIIIAQRLIRKICPNCIESYNLNKKTIKSISEHIDLEKEMDKLKKEGIIKEEIENIRFYRGKGCGQCRDTGYKGRLGIYEVLEISEEIRGLIMNMKDAETIKKQAIKEGMVTMFQDGLRKTIMGKTTIEEILRVTKE